MNALLKLIRSFFLVFWPALAIYSLIVVCSKTFTLRQSWVPVICVLFLFLLIFLSENLQQAASVVRKADPEVLNGESRNSHIRKSLTFIKDDYYSLLYARQLSTIIMIMFFKDLLASLPNPYYDSRTWLFRANDTFPYIVENILSSDFALNTIPSVAVIVWFGQLLPKKIAMEYPILSLNVLNRGISWILIQVGKSGIGIPSDILYGVIRRFMGAEPIIRPGAGTIFNEVSSYFNLHVKERNISINIDSENSNADVVDESEYYYNSAESSLFHIVKLIGPRVPEDGKVTYSTQAWRMKRSWRNWFRRSETEIELDTKASAEGISKYFTYVRGHEHRYVKRTLCQVTPLPEISREKIGYQPHRAVFRLTYPCQLSRILNKEKEFDLHIDVDVPTKCMKICIVSAGKLTVGKITAHRLDGLSYNHAKSMEVFLDDIVKSEGLQPDPSEASISLLHPPYGTRYVVPFSVS